jgi:hypothetical protein
MGWKGARYHDESTNRIAKAVRVKSWDNYHTDPDYELNQPSRSEIDERGRLIVGELKAKKSDLPSFMFRWDEKDDRLDVDIHGDPDVVTEEVKDYFRRGTKGYQGHHPIRKEPLENKTFEIDIWIPGKNVFRGCITFGIDRELGLRATIPIG